MHPPLSAGGVEPPSKFSKGGGGGGLTGSQFLEGVAGIGLTMKNFNIMGVH